MKPHAHTFRTKRQTELLLTFGAVGFFLSLPHAKAQGVPDLEKQIYDFRDVERIFPGFEEIGEESAIAHYIRVAADIGFVAALSSASSDAEFDPDSSTFVDLLAYLGYRDGAIGISPRELEDLTPRELTQRFGGDVIATRFFAPKIMDMQKLQSGIIEPGWRKLIRIKARGQAREQFNVDSAWVLLNYVLPLDKEPFQPGSVSVNNQVMLVTMAPYGNRLPVYWLVYDRFDANRNGQLLRGIRGVAFDRSGVDYYFVPVSCAQCHGALDSEDALLPTGKLNYLDTDHWYAKREAEVPCLPVAQVLFDGRDEFQNSEPLRFASDSYRQAFGVVRELNQEILVQNRAIDRVLPPQTPDAEGASVHSRGVARWLKLHQSNVSPRTNVWERALNARCATAPVWTEEDGPLLTLLDRYCYRCHNGVRNIHVFDKEIVTEKASLMKALVGFGMMPEDRKISVDDRNAIDAALEALSRDGLCR